MAKHSAIQYRPWPKPCPITCALSFLAATTQPAHMQMRMTVRLTASLEPPNFHRRKGAVDRSRIVQITLGPVTRMRHTSDRKWYQDAFLGKIRRGEFKDVQWDTIMLQMRTL